MKRWIGILVLALLLSGCGKQEDTTPTDTTTPTDVLNTETMPSLPDSVTAYEMDAEYFTVKPLGDNILAAAPDRMDLLSCTDARVLSTVSASGLSADMVFLGNEGAAYYDMESRCVVFLNNMLEETSRFQLSEEIQGSIWVTAQMEAVYYCTPSGICVANLQTGMSRSLVVMEAQWLGITGALLDETLLRCQIQKEDGTVRSILVSAETGEIVYTGQELNDVACAGSLYYYDGADGEWIFGWGEEQPQNLWLSRNCQVLPLLESSTLITQTAGEDGIRLDYYDLATGLRTAKVTVTGASDVRCGCVVGDELWLCGGNTLYRWDTSMDQTGDTAVYSEYRYSLEDPNHEGLKEYILWAQNLEKTYNVSILSLLEPEEVVPDNYSFRMEHRVSAYETALPLLEKALSQFPEGFFTDAARWGQNGKVTICLVRSISATGEGDSRGSLMGVEYLKDGNIYIALQSGGNLEEAFYHCLGHLLDTVILSNSHAFDSWDDLNSRYFKYFNDYTSYKENLDTTYLEGNNRYFIYSYSMSYAVEDRATIFEYAVMPGKEEYFTSTYMQAKLKRICDAIREVFDLEDGDYVWEQYLIAE